jgi:hypothetical protein
MADDRYTLTERSGGGYFDIQVPIPGHPGQVVEAEHRGTYDKAKARAESLADDVAERPGRYLGEA